ncbi:MAG: AEC family transporter, partial [Candidatus Colwellbacteria bacterium]|nr:AEC family transporter [Candidatus Colwellbacteria bacterium]
IASSLWSVNLLNAESLEAIQFGLLTILAFSFFLLIIISSTKLTNDIKAALFLIAATGNTIYMGFPIIELHLGGGALSAGALIGTIYLVVPLLISIFVIRYWHNNSHNLSRELVEFIKNPLIISVVIGIALSFVKADNIIIDGARKTLSMLGATASPIALFVLGGFLYGKFMKKNLGLVVLSSALKIAIFPLFVAIAYACFKFGNPNVSILMASMPVAVTTFVISEKFKLDSALVGNAVLLSTALSFIAIPIIVSFF